MLTDEELELFAEDLKHFLVANGVSNEEWVEMNKSDIPKAQEIVGVFSDTVLQKVYERVKYIEHRTPEACMVFQMNQEEINLISINRTNDSIDLSTPESIHEALVSKSESLTMFKTKKAYNKKREEELHEMLEQGCVNSSEAFWMLLEKSLS